MLKSADGLTLVITFSFPRTVMFILDDPSISQEHMSLDTIRDLSEFVYLGEESSLTHSLDPFDCW